MRFTKKTVEKRSTKQNEKQIKRNRTHKIRKKSRRGRKAE
jgi:hypothetical protein